MLVVPIGHLWFVAVDDRWWRCIKQVSEIHLTDNRLLLCYSTFLFEPISIFVRITPTENQYGSVHKFFCILKIKRYDHMIRFTKSIMVSFCFAIFYDRPFQYFVANHMNLTKKKEKKIHRSLVNIRTILGQETSTKTEFLFLFLFTSSLRAHRYCTSSANPIPMRQNEFEPYYSCYLYVPMSCIPNTVISI